MGRRMTVSKCEGGVRDCNDGECSADRKREKVTEREDDARADSKLKSVLMKLVEKDKKTIEKMYLWKLINCKDS